MKNIFYVSNTCSPDKFEALFNESKIKPQQQAQKFHSLFIKGLGELNNNIFVMSALPINSLSMDKFWIKKGKEKEDSVEYCYLPFINLPVLRHIFVFISGFIICFLWSFKKQNKLLVGDPLNLTSSASALLVSKLFRYKSVAIVTDLPDFMIRYSAKKSGIKHSLLSVYASICNFLIRKYDAYMILTEQMNEKINPRKKPYIVIEGMVDSSMKDRVNSLNKKYDEKIIIYAGALYEKYGVKKLIEAFMKVRFQDARLWLFGSGEMSNEIKEFEKVDKRIKYFGVVPNSTVVAEEIKATLLVNPRPSDESFTKFSFPSKNMEYMVSGTPLLTTKLPGMPQEYCKYVYLFENESEMGMTETIEAILSNDKEELFTMGAEAKSYVINEKNNIIQARRLLDQLSQFFI